MNIKIVLVLLGVFCQIASAQTGLVAYYPLDGDARDSSASHLDGVAYNAAATTDRFGMPNSALYFDGTFTSGVDLGEVTRFGLQSFTVSLWVNPSSGNEDYSRIFRYGNYEPSAWNGFGIEYYNPSYPRRPYGTLYHGVPFASSTVSQSESLTVGQWTHIVFCFNTYSGLGQIYIDGTLSGAAIGWCDSATGRASIACENFLGANFQGAVDDVRMYDTVLTGSMVRALFHEGGWVGNPVTRGIVVQKGWNMVSVPVQVADSSVAALFPDALSPAYSWAGTYATPSMLSPGKGYWLKCDSLDTNTVVGPPVDMGEIPVVTGWNIVAFLERDVPVSGIASTPSGIIASNFFGYSGTYFVPTALVSGKGYWVKASADGTLQLAGSLGKPNTAIARVNESWVQIVVEDNAGATSRLYLAKPGEMNGSYELPPVPPAGVLDARFSTSTYVEESSGGTHEIHLSATAYPLTLRASGLGGKALKIRDAVTGTMLNQNVSEGNAIVVQRGLTRLIVEEGEQLPTEFGLSQNYPNPFNPTTGVRYQVPGVSNVKLSVYDILGQEVAVLVNELKEPGTYTVQIDGSALASGTYFYRLEAGSFTSIKKMLILK